MHAALAYYHDYRAQIDDDLLRRLRSEADRTGMPFRATLDRVIRLGLERLQPQSVRPPYNPPVFSMGAALFDVDKALQIAGSLEDEEVQVRRRAARTLGFLGEAAAPAIPPLVRAVRTDAPARNEAGFALGRIGRKSIPALTDLLGGPIDESTRLVAERAMSAATASAPR